MNRPPFLLQVAVGDVGAPFEKPVPFEGEWRPGDVSDPIPRGRTIRVRVRSDKPILAWPVALVLRSFPTNESYTLASGQRIRTMQWRQDAIALDEVRIDGDKTLVFGPFGEEAVFISFRMPFERVPAFEPVVTPKSRLIRRAWARLEPAARLARSILEGLGF